MPNNLPFSPFRTSGNLIFLSGQVGIREGRLVSGDVGEHTTQAIENVNTILKANNLTLSDVVDVTAFLIDQQDYNVFNEIYARSFSEPFPTRTTVTVKSLPLEARIELKVIAQLT